jgi:hypothetical protein
VKYSNSIKHLLRYDAHPAVGHPSRALFAPTSANRFIP